MTATSDLVSVVLPIGPFAHNHRYLDQALESIAGQTMRPRSLVVIDDMAGVGELVRRWNAALFRPLHVTHKDMAWRVGGLTALNIGVASAPTEAAILFASDDLLEPECVACCDAAVRQEDPHGLPTYYWFSCRRVGDLVDTNVAFVQRLEDSSWVADPGQPLPAGPAMVTKRLWRTLGGYPLELVAGGASDTVLVDILQAHPDLFRLQHVVGERQRALYRWRQGDAAQHRPDDDQPDGSARQAIFGDDLIHGIHAAVRASWHVPHWGRQP